MFRTSMLRLLATQCRLASAIKTDASRLISTRSTLQFTRFMSIRNSAKSVQTIMASNTLPEENKGRHIEEIFQTTYAEIINNILSDHKEDAQLKEVKQWLKSVIHYNLRNGKRNRAKTLVSTFELIEPKLTKDNVREACLLGWCIEMLQAYFLIVDDIMDASITRRGQLCWYRQESVGATAINDAIMVNNSLFFILNKHFSSCESYLKIVDLFNEITRHTAYGQCLDLLSNSASKPVDLSKYTMERYDSIVQYKTSYYTFCLPARLALYLANVTDPVVHGKAEEILLRIGHLFQVQDDYLDCYGDPSVTGKIGTDIEDVKCGWLIVKALQLANDSQKRALKQYYGVKSEEAVAHVKAIFDQIGLDRVFREYEKLEFNKICANIENLNEPQLPKDIFYNVLSMIYQRNK